MGKYRTRELTQRVRYALLAGVAGAFLIPQVAAAAPTGEHDMTSGVHVGRTTTAAGTDTNITGTRSAASPTTPSNNVIKWADYSVKQGETVTYDANNYLNIVTGGNTSAINGSITGGGDIYLVNPNGVIFGKTASVNVGNLYVSTQETSTVGAEAFKTSGTAPLSTTAVGKADVVNMGSITANKVEVYGRSIRILDAANVHVTTSPVVLHTDTAVNDGYAHIGHQSGAEPAVTAYEVNGANAVAADNYYQLVSTPTEFQNINSGLTKNYMLANDIDFTDPATHAAGEITPIGGNTISTASGTTTYDAYSGKFDGNFFRVQNYKVTNPALERAGLFGELNHAQIYNLGVTGATVTGDTSRGTSRAGGVAGYSYGGTSFLNVYIKNSTINGLDGYHGGLIGYTTNTTLDSVYSKATIGAGGGIIGYSSSGTTVTNAYSDVKQLPNTSGAYFIYYVLPSSGTTVTNAYSTGLFSYSNSTPNVTNTFIADKDTGKIRGKDAPVTDAIDGYASKNYAAWGNAINNTGAPGAKWRIYEGRTLPLLTAFMDGTATATYDIRYFNANGTLNSDDTNTAKSNNGADITTGLTYNSQYVKIVGKASGADVVGGKSNVVTYAGAMQYNADGTPNLDHIYDYVGTTGTNDFDKTNGIRNAGTKAILWSDQDGPNLRGVNVTIGKRKVDMTVAGHLTAERQYNGKLDVKDAFIEKLLGGGISTDGFTREDSDPNHPTVSLNTTSFTATMVDKHVGTGKVANFGGSIGLSGEDKDNYDFDGNLAGKTGKVDITKAPLLLSFRKKKADDRVYDGTSVVRDDEMKQSVSPGNISINKTIAAGSRGEVMTDETGNADILALADITDPKYTDTAGNEQIHQGAHKLKYTNVKLRTDGIYSSGQDYALYYTPEDNHEVAVTNDTVYLDGSIIRRQIKTGDFKVYHKTDNSAADATKVYDGTATYNLNDHIYLSSNVGATDDNTGVVARDQGHITFLLQNGTTATFMTDEPTPSETKNVKTAKKIAYKVHAYADTDTDGYGGHLLDDYWVVNDKDTALTESMNFNATGKGTITPKALTATVVKNHITKVYDAKQNQTDGNRNDIIGDALVTLSGFATVNGVLETRTNTSTAMYASPNVAWDNAANAPTSQTVTYTAKFDRGTGDEVDNYTFDQTPNTTTVTDSAAVAGSYTGTITPRPITITMGTVDKIYDGTAVNTKSNITGLAGKTAGDTIAATVLADDGITAATLKAQHAAMLSAGTAHSSFGRGTGSSFAEDVNASNGTEHDVRYQNVGDVLQEALAAAKKHNYTIDDTIYGKGTINRRLIEKSDFKVRDKDGGIANATRAYDGTNVFALKAGETLVAKTATAGTDTGVVDKDKNNIFFTMTGNEGHFTSDAAGANRTSHKSEANYAAYDVIADSHDKSVSPLTNYYFGTSYTNKRDLETVNATTPDAVVAAGTITPAQIQAQTKKLKEKVYDGMAEHTDGNRNILTGSEIVALPLIADATGQPTNTSSAAYINKDVERDSNDAIIEKAVNYTAQLKGKYADDYEIVDAGNHVISTLSGTGDSKTVTATRNNVANMGKITPRKLNITMGDVSKTYDGTAGNPSATVTGFTDDPASSVLTAVLGVDNVTASRLTTRYQGMMSASPATATSTYGRGTTSFTANANASNGTPHDVQYTNMRNAFKDEFGSTTAGNYTVDETVYGKGTINRRDISPNNFQVIDLNGHTANATKVYDGTSDYKVPTGWRLSPSPGPGTGIITADQNDVFFRLSSQGAQFADSSDNLTANVATATKVLYNVEATGDATKIRNYTLNGVALENGTGKVSGNGSITRRTINIGISETAGIDKVYDRSDALVNGTVNRKELHHNVFVESDSKANVGYAAGTTNANKLVRMANGYGVDDGAQVTVEGHYADKNVARSGGNVTTKNITYNVKIAGDAGKNYYLTDGSTTVNAETGMNLSATGKITPKDLSGAFKKVTKVYDGTKNVDPSKVGFEIGANGVVSGDVVDLASGHTQEFESPNVRGKDTPWPAPDGTRQHNWVNYYNLSLTGADAGNYTLASTAKGLGEITPYQLNDNSITFTKRQAEKVYDGTRDVKWTDGSSAVDDVKNYITGATVTVGSAPAMDILRDLKLEEAKYDTKDVDGGSAANRVTYKLSYTGTNGNFSLGTGVTSFTTKGDGVITKKDVTVTVRNPLSKTYDATTVVKNAAGNVITGSALNDQVSLSGLTGNDGATYTTTAVYADKNAGTGKTVNYTLAIDGANAGNYNLKYNGADNNGNFSTTNNTITKRKVDVTFAPVSKSYDGTETNNTITPSVSDADAAVLRVDNSAHVSGTSLTNLSGITSQYGTGTKDAMFQANPNAGAKSVQYAGLGAAMGTAFGANNYEFATNGYGKGTITKANINAGDVNFVATNATKTYDGTDRVKFGGSGASNDVRNYITTARVQLNGNWVDLKNDLVMDMNGTKYDSANAGTGIGVTYKFHLNSDNINISGDNNFTKTAQGTIDRRVLTLDLAQKTGINKIYDANENLVDTDTRHYDKFIDDDAKGNVTYASGTTNDNKLVRTSNGATVNDGAKMTITANYANAGVADKNAGVNKDIAYNVRIGGAQGQNYTISYNGTTANAETGLDLTGASGTIAKRKITLGFGDVSKPYDTTPNNNTKNITSVTAGNTDGRGAATLTADGITSASFDTTGIVSYYGAGTTDEAFQRNPNVVTDANGNVIPNGKDVQYSNLANTLAAQLYAANYEITNTAYGKGTIRKRTVTANDFTFNINNATKMYDGTRDVEYVENGQTYKDLAHVKKRFQNSKLDLGGGNLVDINLEDIDLTGAAYNDERVAHANGVNYDVTINTKNFEFTGSRNRTINHTGDTITKRDLATKLPPHLIKEYDGEDTFTETNEIFANAMARANLTGVVDRDKNNIQLKVKGTYNSPDASVETRADAEARKPATARRNVAYELTLSGDADTLSNYKIGTVETLDSNGEMKGNGSGKADIYKKTLTVSADPIDKVYDGTRTVVRPDGLTTAPHPAANKLKLNGFAKSTDHFDFDQTAADKIDGLYSDPNVSRAADGTILDKDIAYSGVKAAFKNYVDNHAGSAARNYRVDSDTVSGKGKITQRTITSNDIANGLTLADATKVYDGTTKVKYNGQNTLDALKNYLTSATVNINGTPIDIKKELTIRADEASTHYDTANVAGGAQSRVTYTLNYTGGNFDITGPITKTANGVITKRQVTAYAPGQLTKEYDGTPKVYDSGDPTIKTYYRGNQVTSGADIVQLEEENGDRGLLTNDGVQNISTAMFRDKNAGTRKVVDYNIAVDAAHAGNYELVDRRGNVISQTSTNNNTITPRHLDITFGDVRRAYDGTSTNTDVTALVKDSDARATLRRDGVNLSGEQLRLRDAANNDITLPSDYGYGRTDSAFTKNADANQTGEPPKDVQYRKLGDAMRTLLGNDAGNYYFDETGYGKGRITKASVRESDFRLKFGDAVKEYDGTPDVHNAAQYLDKTASHASSTVGGTTSTITLTDDDYVSVDGKYDNKNAGDPTVHYKVKISNKNFNFGTWDGIVQRDGDGHIDKRKLIADPSNYLTKEYDGTAEIIGKARNAQGTLITAGGDKLVKFHHYGGTPTHPDDGEDTVFYKDAAAGTVSIVTTAAYAAVDPTKYADKDVEWKNNVWNQGRGVVGDKNVNYEIAPPSGADAANYEVVHADGTAVTPTNPYVGKGKITPKEIVLKADPQERWINEGLPTSYTGTPQGTNLSHNEVPEIVPSDAPLPGTITYSSPNARLRVGYYAVNGTYKAQGGTDGDTVSRNYRFVEDPANDTALYIGPYIPDYEYYKAMTQVSKMTPDEYAYENASLDRKNQYSRKPTAQVDPVPPAINVVKDGVDIRQNDINVLDDTVYTIVDEVFG